MMRITPTRREHPCAVCGKTVNHRQAHTCSRACAMILFRLRIGELPTSKRTCRICGKEYIAYAPNSATCSPECRRKNKNMRTQKLASGYVKTTENALGIDIIGVVCHDQMHVSIVHQKKHAEDRYRVQAMRESGCGYTDAGKVYCSSLADARAAAENMARGSV